MKRRAHLDEGPGELVVVPAVEEAGGAALVPQPTRPPDPAPDVSQRLDKLDSRRHLWIIQGVFFDWSPLKCLSMELALPPQFQTGPPPTQNVIKFVKELQYNT